MTGSFAEDNIAILIYEHFQVTGTPVAILDYCDLSSIALHGDDIQSFDSRWDDVLWSIENVSRVHQ